MNVLEYIHEEVAAKDGEWGFNLDCFSFICDRIWENNREETLVISFDNYESTPPHLTGVVETVDNLPEWGGEQVLLEHFYTLDIELFPKIEEWFMEALVMYWDTLEYDDHPRHG